MPFAERPVDAREGEEQLPGRQDRGKHGRERKRREEKILPRAESGRIAVVPVPDEPVEVFEGPPERRADRKEEEEAAGAREDQAPTPPKGRGGVDDEGVWPPGGG